MTKKRDQGFPAREAIVAAWPVDLPVPDIDPLVTCAQAEALRLLASPATPDLVGARAPAARTRS